MKQVFADANYLIALLNTREQLHLKAKALAEAFSQARIVTSEMVLVEVLTFCANGGPRLREAAADVAAALADNPNATVVPQTSLQFQKALHFYRQRSDKEWSPTDCASFLIMEELGLAEALSCDRHFEQAGFKALLRGSD